jgi:hypothetical protein
MRIGTRFISAAAGLVLAGTAAVQLAAAAPLGHSLSFGNAASSGHVENVRWRGGGGSWGGRGHWGGPWRGGYGYRGWGAAPFVGGLAAGAIVGGALAYPRYYSGPYPDAYVDNYAYDTYADDNYAGGDAAGYCAQRFRSYDPRSGTYLGYDGQRHPCP